MACSDVISRLDQADVRWIRMNDNSRVIFPESFEEEVYLRINNFPNEPAYTLMLRGDAVDLSDEISLPDVSSTKKTESASLSEIPKIPIKWKITSSELAAVAELDGRPIYLIGSEFYGDEVYELIGFGETLGVSKFPPNWSIVEK